jgi:hypothetical protein
MIKLLYKLLIVSLVFSACQKEEEVKISPIFQVIVGEKWEGYIQGFGNIIFELNVNNSLAIYDTNSCGGYLPPQYLGSWSFSGDTIYYIDILNNNEYKEVFGIVTEFSSNLIKFYIDQFSQSICSIHYSDSSCTYVPDNNFEAYLESNGMGNGIENDDYVSNANINTISFLDLSNQNISDITGIEAFKNLNNLICNNNKLISLDLSNNTYLNQLNCNDNLLISLDLRNGRNLSNFSTLNNPNLTCISVNEPSVYLFDFGIGNVTDSHHYYSYNCLN